MPANIIEKIWSQHVVSQKEGHPAIFAIDLQLLHEVTSAQAFQVLRERNWPVWNKGRFLATIDHSIPTRKDRHEIHDSQAKTQVEKLRQNVADFGVPIYDFDSGHQGIVHVIGPELGITQPGMTIVCGDSHTSTHGAFGALAFGVGTTEVGHVLATGCILQQKPKTMKVEFAGQFQPGVYSKDAILALIAKIGIGGANGHIIEYTGEAVRSMSMEERLTVCNMSIECGARAGLVAPDETTFEYIKGRRYAPTPEKWDEAVEYWKSLQSDPGATYDKEITIDVSQLAPMVTWGINPEQGIQINEKTPRIQDLPATHHENTQAALEYTGLSENAPIAETPIDWAFLGSCTNSRLNDLREAAQIIKQALDQGQKISEHVTMYVVPGSESVKAQAEAEGLDKIFIEAGASWRNPGCSMCLGMNDDKVPSGKRCISTSNRNFRGRQGPGSITHLASPATVAASAIAGKITPPPQWCQS